MLGETGNKQAFLLSEILLLLANKVWGKVMFYHRSLSVHGGGGLPACIKQGSHSDWKTWQNGKAFSSHRILNRLEKSGKTTQNTGKLG